MYTEKPRIVMPALILIFATLFAFFAWKMPDDGRLFSGLKIVCAGIAFFLAVWGAGELLQYIVDFIAYSRRELNQAAYPLMLAGALRGASPDVVGILAREGALKVVGIMGENLRCTFAIQALPVDIEWDFAVAFVTATRQTYPYLWPIDRCDELQDDEGNPYVNYERQGLAFTNLLISHQAADPGVGNKSARLIIHWSALAEAFGVER